MVARRNRVFCVETPHGNDLVGVEDFDALVQRWLAFGWKLKVDERVRYDRALAGGNVRWARPWPRHYFVDSEPVVILGIAEAVHAVKLQALSDLAEMSRATQRRLFGTGWAA